MGPLGIVLDSLVGLLGRVDVLDAVALVREIEPSARMKSFQPHQCWVNMTISLVVSCCPMMSAEPSRVHVTPRMRGPTGSSISFRNGVPTDSGSAIQMDAGAFVF